MAFLPGNILFNKIIILQSLDSEDRKTGTELHDDTVSRATWKHPNVQTQIIQIETSLELFEVLDGINNDVRHNEVLPFIHFETHGTTDGLSLASGENVKWTDMLPLIGAINLNTDNNLFISVAACWGGRIQFKNVGLLIGGCSEIPIVFPESSVGVRYLDVMDLMAKEVVSRCYNGVE